MLSEFSSQVRARLVARGVSARSASLEAGLPIRAIQSVLEGHSPTICRAFDICAALGLEFYIGPPRQEGAAAVPPPPAPADPEGIAPVADREIEAVIAVLADEYEELDQARRAGLLTRFWSFFPDLRERAVAREGRRLSRLARG